VQARHYLNRRACTDLPRSNAEATFPDICHTTQETVDGVYELYGTVRLLIGSLLGRIDALPAHPWGKSRT
jgi:hypothetical protein